MERRSSQLPGLHPEEQALREELVRLRASLTAMMLQKDELLLIQCKRVEAAYLRRFGALELRIYEAWCGCLRAKKKAKLIRARQNRRDDPALSEIETVLDQEMETHQRELEERFQRVNGVMEQREHSGLSGEGRRELRDLYRKAVKSLHPDLNPQAGEEAAQDLQRAMRAYRAGDLEGLRLVCERLNDPAEIREEGLEALQAHRARLRKQLRGLDRELEEIKNRYPYSMRVYLEDEAKGRARQEELESQLSGLLTRQQQYEAAIAAMLAPEEDEDG